MNKPVLCVAVALFSSTARAGDHDALALGLDEQEQAKWEVGYSKHSGDISITEFVPKGETVKNWTRMLTIQGFRKSLGSPSVQALAEEFKKGLVQKCPDVIWNVIASQKSEIVYEWSVENCSGVQDQHEIAKYIQGKWTQFRVAYSQKVKQLEPEERDTWLRVVCETTVTIEKGR